MRLYRTPPGQRGPRSPVRSSSRGWRLVLAAIGLALGLSGGIVAPAAAAVVNIDCPLRQARHEVTTRLPSGWWNTPIVARLRATSVRTIGGRRALICDYGPRVGSVQRYEPAGATCTPRSGGFRCVTASPTPPAPSTFSTGRLSIRQTYEADLDRGRIRSAGADLWFQAETARRKYLVPVNGARFSISGARNRGYAGCSGASFSSRRIPVAGLRVGTYICYRTDHGRIGEFRINRIDRGRNAVVHIGYTTWR